MSSKTEEAFGSLAVLKPRKMREYLSKTRAKEATELEKCNKDEKKLTISSENTKLGAMMLKGYLAKSKVFAWNAPFPTKNLR